MAAVLTATQVDSMQSTVRSTYRAKAVQIRRAVTVSDGAGGRTAAWSTVGTVDGRVDRAASQERSDEVEGRSAIRTRAVVWLPAGTDVRQADRLLVDGVTWEVQSIRDRHSSIELARTVEVVEVTP